ncbi:transposase family protein [Shigella flexneri K-315]|uniref:Transposase family protein n=2 Tax=Shigella flexneri TaxID=623 RepID=I6C8H5_SHIFL|nr:transposase family protein [Shigella flexneri K-315]
MLTRVKYPTLASICLTESHTALRKNQRYSKEFKAEAVRTVLENQLSISEGASRLSLPEGTLGQWVTAARKGLGTPGSRTVAELESEILQLRKALNEARLERDILKKQQRILHRSR